MIKLFYSNVTNALCGALLNRARWSTLQDYGNFSLAAVALARLFTCAATTQRSALAQPGQSTASFMLGSSILSFKKLVSFDKDVYHN